MKIYDFNGKKNICADRVREARQKLRLSQSQLAAQLQIKGIILERGSVSRIESGARFVTDYEIKALSEILKVDVLWLLS
ncbi:MAG: helix-turn-helix transcriptional regulator [Oscillospiraceae bacterium]|nr:helix-turn-helix transcriptional regulator [Oscillospiraceae bacterium]